MFTFRAFATPQERFLLSRFANFSYFKSSLPFKETVGLLGGPGALNQPIDLSTTQSESFCRVDFCNILDYWCSLVSLLRSPTTPVVATTHRRALVAWTTVSSAQAHFAQQCASLDHYLYRLQGNYRDPTRTRNEIIELLRHHPALQPRAAPLGTTALARFACVCQRALQTLVSWLAPHCAAFTDEKNLGFRLIVERAHTSRSPLCSQQKGR